MRASETMTRYVATVPPDATLQDAARLMDDLNVGALPVCDNGRLVGIVTDRDITVRATADGMLPDRTPVYAVATSSVCWCYEDDPVEDIQRAMARRQIRRMPVVDGRKRLVGMLALGDLATNRAPGAEEALRSISEPSKPDRQRRPSGYRFGPWPGYGGYGGLPRW